MGFSLEVTDKVGPYAGGILTSEVKREFINTAFVHTSKP
jgi:hypothetical protein